MIRKISDSLFMPVSQGEPPYSGAPYLEYCDHLDIPYVFELTRGIKIDPAHALVSVL